MGGESLAIDDQNDGAGFGSRGVGFIRIEDRAHAGAEDDLDFGELGRYEDAATSKLRRAHISRKSCCAPRLSGGDLSLVDRRNPANRGWVITD
jgi:hypothetical protein